MDNIQLLIIVVQTIILIAFLKYFEKLFFRFFSVLRVLNVHVLQKRNTNNIFYFTFCGYIFFFLILTNINTDTLTWIENPRNGYQFSRQGAGIWYAFSIIFLGINSVILFIYRIKKIRTLIFFSIMYCYFWYLFGGKAYIIAFFTLVLLASTINFQYRYTKLIFLMAISAVFFVVLFLFFNNGLSFTLIGSLDSILSYFDHYYYSSMFYADVLNSNFDFFNGEIFITSFYKYVPRAIFIDKPYVYGSVLLNEIYLPGLAELGHTPEFAGQAAYYADFGLLGVLLFNFFDFNFIIKTFFYLLVLKYAKRDNNIFGSLYFTPLVFSFAPAFSQFISFPFDLFIIIIFVLFFSIFYKKRGIQNRVSNYE